MIVACRIYPPPALAHIPPSWWVPAGRASPSWRFWVPLSSAPSCLHGQLKCLPSWTAVDVSVRCKPEWQVVSGKRGKRETENWCDGGGVNILLHVYTHLPTFWCEAKNFSLSQDWLPGVPCRFSYVNHTHNAFYIISRSGTLKRNAREFECVFLQVL